MSGIHGFRQASRAGAPLEFGGEKGRDESLIVALHSGGLEKIVFENGEERPAERLG